MVGFNFVWDENFSIESKIVNNSLVIKANKAGLLSLARHLEKLAGDEFPNHYHFHLDETNPLEEGSVGIVFEKNNI